MISKTKSKSRNVTWQSGEVGRQRRRQHFGHGGATLWLTGLSAAGKTSIATATEAALLERGVGAYRLDGDNLRHGICGDLGFSEEDRNENIRRAGEIAKLVADSGLIALAAFISPYRKDRAFCRRIHEQAELPFVEVFVDCPLAVAEERDPKGLYAKAREGLIDGFTGIDAPYEAPEHPDVHLRTDRMSIDDEVEQLVAALAERGVLD